MRIWSKQLIPVLPDKQLKAMRYELGDMIKQYPNIKHSLVKFANNYDIWCLYSYFIKVSNEYEKRTNKVYKNYNSMITQICLKKTKLLSLDIINFMEDFTYDEDDEKYLEICWWNLYEKYIRGMINDLEWKRIQSIFVKEI